MIYDLVLVLVFVLRFFSLVQYFGFMWLPLSNFFSYARNVAPVYFSLRLRDVHKDRSHYPFYKAPD